MSAIETHSCSDPGQPDAPLSLSKRILRACSIAVLATSLLPLLPVPVPASSAPFGLVVIVYGVFLTFYGMKVGWSRFAAWNVLSLLLGSILHTIAFSASTNPSIASTTEGYEITISLMAFTCFLWGAQFAAYGKTEESFAANIGQKDLSGYPRPIRFLIGTLSAIIIPIFAIIALCIVIIATGFVLIPFF